MKAILTLIFVLIIAIPTQAKEAQVEFKVETIKTTIETFTTYGHVNLESKTEVARLYKFKNARIKKALSFTTKRNKAIMA